MEDLIRRSDAVAILEDLQKDHLQFCLIPFRQAIERVQAIPSADSTGDLDNAIYEYVKEGLMDNPYDRPQGEWIAKTESYHSLWVCSECGSWALLEYNEQMCLSNFCPNCGAYMKGADDE